MTHTFRVFSLLLLSPIMAKCAPLLPIPHMFGKIRQILT
jgi:hypothetical protein